MTILLVNDEKIVRTLVAVALRRQRYDVLEAATARRAVTVARNHRGPIDLLLAQLSIPGMNGLELARHLGTENPELRSLFLSRWPHPVRLEQQAHEEARSVVREPFEMDHLLEEVARTLGIVAGRRKPVARSGGDAGAKRARTAVNGHSRG